MRITESQLRKIIRDEVKGVWEAKRIDALYGVKSPYAQEIKLGDIFTNDRGGQISITRLKGIYADWDVLNPSMSRVQSISATREELLDAIADGGYTLHARVDDAEPHIAPQIERAGE